MKWTQVLLIVAAFAFAQKPEKPLKNGLYAIFNTELGKFTAQLYEKDTPNSVATFVGLAQGTIPWKDPKTGAMVKRPLFDNTTFYRVLPGQAIQGGSPTGSAAFDCGFTIRDEILPGLQFNGSGRLAMANANSETVHDTGGCQFFITVGPVPAWSNNYAIFGQVVQGEDVVTKINKAPVHGDQPVSPVKLTSVTIERVGPAPVVKKPKK
ncbi:MAG TPA: peptidylprolyl isomerase [Bryobacteraceae bacterium]|nr:peptidylprolyl isomerase [Bryobacteraceae bacterium]